MKIGVIGNGFVGHATSLLACKDVTCIIYDIDPTKCSPLHTTLQDIYNCNIIFIAVPTPMEQNGMCHLHIIEGIIDNMNKHIDLSKSLVVLRSTVPPGTANKLQCYFMPEFLTEKNYIHDFIHNNEWIFGLKDANVCTEQNAHFTQTITQLINIAHAQDAIKYNHVHFIPNTEAEMVKLFRNTFLATKVSFCNEMSEFCALKNIDYATVAQYATLDNRITNSHIHVPGPDGKLGFGGTCFPKDCNNVQYEMNKVGMKSYIISNVLARNIKKDRPEQDWTLNKNRAVI